MSHSAPRTISVSEYAIYTHGAPLVAMTDDLGTEMQRAGLHTRDQISAVLATAADLAGPSSDIGAYSRLETSIALASQWAPLWLVYSSDAGGYVATWPW